MLQRVSKFLWGVGLVAACTALPTINANALDYPTRQPHIYVGYPPGGSTDIVARLLADWFSRRLGQQFIVENRPGASNNLATDAVAKAAPDGYTMILVNPANTINATLYKHLKFVFLRDIDPVAGIIRIPNVMEVNPSVPAKTVAEFIAYVKANPDKVNVASSGNGTSIHLSGELFKMMTGTKMTHVPYKGSAPMLTDLLGGQVQVTFDNLPSSIGHIRAGKLRALAVTTAKRSEELPDVPTVGETVPGYEASAFFGLGVPHGTPKEIVELLNKEVNAALKDPAMVAKLRDLGGTPIPGSVADFGKVVADETAKWEKVVHAANLSID
ncbi:MAG TPA: tripartite tricarboxylate transporter substrate binding protein [Pseudolabrys sp.]|jgi:tripartite-type tricarboxylate transporter receptor subunit TctC|nr:tripartite tricarboxylate transporter substrate binding protein [Pseudolabrys sp.]